MSEPIVVISPGGGEVVGDSLDRRVEILADDDALHATWSRFAAGREGADLHVHHRHTDLFYVLAGELTIRLGIDDERVAVPSGSLVRVPPLVVHGFLNAAGEEVRYLNLHAPGRGFTEFMRGIRDGSPVSYDQVPPPDDGGRPISEAEIGASEVVAEGAGMRVMLLADVGEIAVAEVASDGGELGVGGPQLESLYVLEGEVAIAADGNELVAETGSWVELAPGAAATVSSPGSARYLRLRTPGAGLAADLRGLADR